MSACWLSVHGYVSGNMWPLKYKPGNFHHLGWEVASDPGHQMPHIHQPGHSGWTSGPQISWLPDVEWVCLLPPPVFLASGVHFSFFLIGLMLCVLPCFQSQDRTAAFASELFVFSTTTTFFQPCNFSASRLTWLAPTALRPVQFFQWMVLFQEPKCGTWFKWKGRLIRCAYSLKIFQLRGLPSR